MTEIIEPKKLFTDWLIMRLFNRPEEGIAVCMLTTRGNLLARHNRLYLRRGVGEVGEYRKVPGLRRYKTEKMAKAKAKKMNKTFNTVGYSAIREDQI